MSLLIGISSHYHDSACCLFKDGKLICAIQEERLTRIKHEKRLPISSISYCLNFAKVTIHDLDCIAYYEIPAKKANRQLVMGKQGNPEMIEKEIRDKLGYVGIIKYYGHHLSHAASSYFFSGYEEAAIFVNDGVGEWDCTSYGTAQRNQIDIFENVQFPNSIGLLYSAITAFLGFRVNNGEYKVMGLASYGNPTYYSTIKKTLINQEKGKYTLNMKYFNFLRGDKMYAQALSELLKCKPRRPNTLLKQIHKDIAHSTQVVIEEILLQKIKYLQQETALDNLCLAGGVALNCVANGKIEQSRIFKNVFVPPAPHDAGSAIGAAFLAYLELYKKRPKFESTAYLGPTYENDYIKRLFVSTKIKYLNYEGRETEILATISTSIKEGKIVGWFQGKLEFGPRALGNRSILADPRNPKMKDKINHLVKKREHFRPFAPVILEEFAKDYFDNVATSPFMTKTFSVKATKQLPAVTHIDGSARIQTISETQNQKLYLLLKAFYKKTNCPVLLNTSFNIKGDPIVCSPLDALICFVKSGIDILVINDFIVFKENIPCHLKSSLVHWKPKLSTIPRDVYTFF